MADKVISKRSRDEILKLSWLSLLGITALLTAWATWIGSLHGGNQATNYTKSNNIAGGRQRPLESGGAGAFRGYGARIYADNPPCRPDFYRVLFRRLMLRGDTMKKILSFLLTAVLLLFVCRMFGYGNGGKSDWAVYWYLCGSDLSRAAALPAEICRN